MIQIANTIELVSKIQIPYVFDWIDVFKLYFFLFITLFLL